MAASIACRSARRSLCFSSRILTTFVRNKRTAASTEADVGVYHYILPNAPPDTPETNAFLRYKDYPIFPAMCPDDAFLGFVKSVMVLGSQVDEHADKLIDSKQNTFESIFEEIEKALVPFQNCRNTMLLLHGVLGTTDFGSCGYLVNYHHLDINRRFTNQILYEAVKELANNRDQLNEYQQRLVDIYMSKFNTYGMSLKRQRSKHLMTELHVDSSKQVANYNYTLMKCKHTVEKRIYNYREISDLPQAVIRQLAENPIIGLGPNSDDCNKENYGRSRSQIGPWTVRFVNANLVHSIFRYSSNRALREEVWISYRSLGAPIHYMQRMTTKDHLEKLFSNRQAMAKARGRKNYAELLMENRMAESLDQVLEFINYYKKNLDVKVKQDLNELKQLAKSDGLKEEFQLWDLHYYLTKQLDDKYPIDMDMVHEYFQFDKVLSKLFDFSSQLFGITIKECPNEVDTWHESVRFYKVYNDQGSEVAAFYLDAFSRPEKIVPEAFFPGRSKSKVLGLSHFFYFILNITRPYDQGPTVLSLREIESMYQTFGKGLQQMLSESPYAETSGLNNIEIDAADVGGNVLKRWIYEPKYLQSLSSHFETGEQLPIEIINTLLARHKYMAPYFCADNLYISEVDLAMYYKQVELDREAYLIYKKYNYLPVEDADRMFYSRSHLIDELHCGYYSFIWSEMVAADIFRSFKDAGLDNPEKISELGNWFKSTILNLSGSLPAKEVFRRFQGRDPEWKFYLEELLTEPVKQIKK